MVRYSLRHVFRKEPSSLINEEKAYFFGQRFKFCKRMKALSERKRNTWKINGAQHNYNCINLHLSFQAKFKNKLKTIEAEIVQKSKNSQPQPKIYNFLRKKNI